MRWLRRYDRRRPRVRLLVVLLVLTLLLSGGLGYHALDAARSHRETAERALREYAGIAAWEFTRRAREQMLSATFLRLRSVERMDYQVRAGRLPSVQVLAQDGDQAACDCAGVSHVHTYFRLDLEDRRIVVTSDSLSPAARQWLADTLLRIVPRRERERASGLIGLPRGADRATDLVAYTLVHDREARPAGVYGFVSSFEGFHDLFARYCGEQALLPPALAGGQPNDSILSVAVYTPDHAVVYESTVRYPDSYAAADTVGAQWGGLVVRASLRPDVAENLLIGGLPTSRLPLVFGMLLVTLAVGAAALHQIRRENELARLRDDFVSGVSHELRTPLAQIRMFSELLEDGRLRSPEERERSTEIIHREAKRLTHLVENILLFSRSRRHAIRLAPVELDVGEVVGELTEAFAPLADARRMRVVFHREGPLRARADRDALSQIVLNLLDNAVKYGPAGQTIAVTARGTDDEVIITVDDAGPGVPTREREAVFQPYRRLERDVSAATTGSGIGLAVVRELAERHGGIVRVETAPGGGARFVITLRRPGTADAPTRLRVADDRRGAPA